MLNLASERIIVMPRKKCVRHVSGHPEVVFYKPAGIPMCELEEVVLHVDELEAVKLADHEGLYQEAAAERMQVSRATFGRILAEAHRKISDALVNGKGLRIDGGHFEIKSEA